MGEVHRLVPSETVFGLQAAGRLMNKIFAPWVQDLSLLAESVEAVRPPGAQRKVSSLVRNLGFNGFSSRKIPARDHHMFANLFGRSGMFPRSPNLRQAAHHIGSEAPFSSRRSVQNQIAVSGVERDEPVVNYRFDRLQPSTLVRSFPEPAVGQRNARIGGHAAFIRHQLTSVLLKRLQVVV